MIRSRARNQLQEFLQLESSGGIVLMFGAIVAMIVANSPLASHYASLLALPVSIKAGDVGLAKPLHLWINDGLMAVFFFLVGMELKREMVQGHLSSLRRASLPAFAAVGGMAAPALIYAAFNRSDADALRGWAIPTATDIAFALGVLSLLGNRVPSALKAFLLSIAIFDDLGAILVIAFFYTAKLSVTALVVSAALIVGLFILNRADVRRPAAYFLLGIPLWIAVLKSGVHATLAGVVLAMFIPLRISRGNGLAGLPADQSPPSDSTSATESAPAPEGTTPPAHGHDEQEGMLHRLEHSLHPWVAFGILPIFAFANAGVSLRGLSFADLLDPVPAGIMAGLVLGKPAGILIFSALAVAARAASLPEGTRWSHLCGVSILCGIGFTMSLFVASLAFEAEGISYRGTDRLGILAGSLCAGAAGFWFLRWALERPVAARS